MYASEAFEFHSVKAADLLTDQNVRVIARNSVSAYVNKHNKQKLKLSSFFLVCASYAGPSVEG